MNPFDKSQKQTKEWNGYIESDDEVESANLQLPFSKDCPEKSTACEAFSKILVLKVSRGS